MAEEIGVILYFRSNLCHGDAFRIDFFVKFFKVVTIALVS